jgi:GPI ethanolamine phosphate transferase 1
MIDSFYNDGKTAYVFTADHGMSDWGSHGDGHPDNTRTPLIAWGAGVKKPVVVKDGKAPGHEDGFSSDWGLDHVPRHDVEQADVAALMAHLAGLEYPTNSVGKLPLAYLSASLPDQAEAALANAQGVLEMYRVKEEQKRAVELRYRPFPQFGTEEVSIRNRTETIRGLIDQRDYAKAIEESHALLDLGLQGMRYLQTYDWLFLRALVSLGYLGWMAFALTTVIDLHVLHSTAKPSRTTATTAAFGAIGVALFGVLLARHAPITYYAYAAFPIAFWEEVVARRNALSEGRKALLGHLKTGSDWSGLAMKCVAGIFAMELLVLSYFYREVYSLCYLAAISWPFFYGKEFVRQKKALIGMWAAGCALMSTFTLLPAIKVEDSQVVLLGGFLMLSAGILYLLFDHRLANTGRVDEQRQYALSRALVGVQIGLVLLAMIVTQSSVASLQAKQGLPTGNQIVGWLVLGEFTSTLSATSANISSVIARHAFPPHSVPQQALPPPLGRHLPHFLSDLYHSHDLIRGHVLFLVLLDLGCLGTNGAPHLHLPA